MKVIELSKQPVELYKILKFEGLVDSGGEAKAVISEGHVSVNGTVELQKRKKIMSGDVIEFGTVQMRAQYVAPREAEAGEQAVNEGEPKVKAPNEKAPSGKKHGSLRASPFKSEALKSSPKKTSTRKTGPMKKSTAGKAAPRKK